jgi:hypothetical protein
MEREKKLSKTQLVIERSDGELWGRISIKGNLITDNAKNLQTLKKQLKDLALEIEGIEIGEFEVSYDLTSFFEQHSELNVSEIANIAGINPGLMRQYASGVKYPSEERIQEIEKAIHEIGKKLTKIKLHKSQKELA